MNYLRQKNLTNLVRIVVDKSITTQVQSLEIFPRARHAVALSENMLDMALQSQWKQFEKTEKQRQLVLTQIFSHPAISVMLPRIAILLQQILEYDNQSLQLGDQARKQTMQELAAIHSNVEAVDIYQQLSSYQST